MVGSGVRAGVVTQPGKVEIQEFPWPTTGDQGGVLEVEATALAGIDFEWFSDVNVDSYDSVSDFRFPFIPGHIVVGRIAEISDHASEKWALAPGERVIVQYDVSCYRCEPCRVGDFERCSSLAGYGLWFDFTAPPYLWGGAAEYMVLHPNSRLVKVSEDRSAAELCLLERCADATNWIMDAGELKPAEDVVIFGTGALGQAAVMVARMAGARRVIVVGRSESHRLDALADIGADLVVTGSPDDVVDQIMAVTQGNGAQLVLDVTSALAPEIPATALRVASYRGRVVQVAVKSPPAIGDIDSSLLVTNQLTYRGVLGHRPQHLRRAVALDSGPVRPPLEKARFSTYALEDLGTAISSSPSDDGSVLAIIAPTPA